MIPSFRTSAIFNEIDLLKDSTNTMLKTRALLVQKRAEQLTSAPPPLSQTATNPVRAVVLLKDMHVDTESTLTVSSLNWIFSSGMVLS